MIATRCSLLALALAGFSVDAGASPVTWDLVGANTTYGGVVAGSFVFDDASNTYSSVRLVATVPFFPQYTFTSSGCNAGSLCAHTTGADLTLVFSAPLTAAGGSIGIGNGTMTAATTTGQIAAVQATGSVVARSAASDSSGDGPLPLWALGALGAGLVGIVWMRMQKLA
jgi:hypothetical protein